MFSSLKKKKKRFYIRSNNQSSMAEFKNNEKKTQNYIRVYSSNKITFKKYLVTQQTKEREEKNNQ